MMRGKKWVGDGNTWEGVGPSNQGWREGVGPSNQGWREGVGSSNRGWREGVGSSNRGWRDWPASFSSITSRSGHLVSSITMKI